MKLPPAGCQCGKIRYEITAAPTLVYTCHCRDCQRLTSSAFSVGIVVVEAGFRLVIVEERTYVTNVAELRTGKGNGWRARFHGSSPRIGMSRNSVFDPSGLCLRARCSAPSHDDAPLARAIRCANIKGRAPRNRGSCRIWLEGDHAGDWVDFDDKDRFKGQPLSTIKENLGLEEGQVYRKALKIIRHYGAEHYLTEVPQHKNGNGNRGGVPAVSRSAAFADFYISQEAQCAIGSLIETEYWPTRRFGKLPDAVNPQSDGKADLLFVPGAQSTDIGTSYPTIVCRLRNPDGELIGASQFTYLLPDGSWHIGKIEAYKGFAKKTFGSSKGGFIKLAPINERGELGIAEGLETAAAGAAYYDVPAWASVGTSNMRWFADWLVANPGKLPLRRLLIFADKGEGGIAAALYLYRAALSVGIAVELYIARGDGCKDLADDRVRGLPTPPQLRPEEIAALAPTDQAALPLGAEGAGDAPEGAGPPIAEQPGLGVAPSPAAPAGGPGAAGPPAWASEPAAAAAVLAAGPQPTLSEISARLMALERGVSGDAVTSAITDIVTGRLDPANKDQMINLMYRRTGIKKSAIVEMVRQLEGQSPIPNSGNAPRPWLSKVAINNDGSPKGIMSNAAIVIREADEIKGSLGLNEFTGMISVLKKWPWETGYPNPCEVRPWTDEDELAMTEWVQGIAGIHAPRAAIFDAVQRVANEYKFHPVREYLSSLEWDHISRLDKAASYYFGAEDTEYHREVFKRWLLSGVARIYHPGVKADCMTVFEGEQNIGKSTAIRILFDPWFTDQLAEIGTKDSSLELRGIWGAEYGEL